MTSPTEQPFVGAHAIETRSHLGLLHAERVGAGKGAGRRARPILGILLKLASVACFAGMAACVKYLARDVPVGETVFLRALMGVAVALAMAWSSGRRDLLATRNIRSHAIRSLAATASLFAWFVALTLIPLADAQAILLTGPMFVTILAVLFLGEPIDSYRVTALAVGLIGVLIMIAPQLSLGTGSPSGILIALGSALAGAVSMLLIRSMTLSEHASTMLFYHSLSLMLCSAITALWGWSVPSTHQLLLMILAGTLATLAQVLLTSGYRYAEASTIAPLEYFSMLAAVLSGYFIFGELPRPSVWIGAMLVIAVGLVILCREYQLSNVAARGAPLRGEFGDRTEVRQPNICSTTQPGE